MREAIPILLLAALAFTGCMTDDPSLDGAATDGDENSGSTWDDATDSDFNWTGLEPSYPYHAMEEFCTDEASCDYWDGQFHEGTVYELDTLVIDAIVMPVPAAEPMSATAAAGQATAAWSSVKEYTADWFTDAWELNTYVVGTDVPSADAIQDPEIIVVSESGQRSTSIGLNAEQLACGVVGAEAVLEPDVDFVPGSLATRVYPVHEHDGMAIFAAECITGGFRCFALNFAGALGGNNALYDLVAHEVGHCLGLSHVGDALDFNSRFVPTPDIMAYADNPSRVSCPSTLNARVMEGIYAELAGQPMPEWMQNGTRFAMDPWDYQTVECPLPPQGIL